MADGLSVTGWRVPALFLLALLFAGCVRGHWVLPPDRTEADLRVDRYECRREAMAIRPPVPASPVYIAPQPPPRGGSRTSAALQGFAQGLEEGSARRAARAATDQAQEEQEALYRLCLEARGYRWERPGR